MLSEIKKWGNSAAIRLPSKVLAAAGLDMGCSVTIEVDKGKVVIEATADKPKKKLKLPFSESQLISGLDEYTAHADSLATLSTSELGE
ncbi:MAG: AbrB/MazE/SpoVT family DNA-binding domain-containing protein [Cellvibrionaceae bacterium]